MEEHLVLQALRHRSEADGVHSDSHARALWQQVLLDRCELLAAPAAFSYLDVNGQVQQIILKAGSLAYTICQTPFTLEVGNELCISVQLANGDAQQQTGKLLDEAMVFPYENEIVAITHGDIISSDESLRQTFETFLKEMDLRAGASMVFPNLMDLKYAYIQSKIALKEGTTQSSDECLFQFQKHYYDHLIHSLDEATSLKCLCHPKLLQMVMKGGKNEREAIHSLRSYIINGRILSTTAAMLYVHRNTLMYRLKRIEEMLELNLKDLDEQALFSLYLSCLIIEHLDNIEPINK